MNISSWHEIKRRRLPRISSCVLDPTVLPALQVEALRNQLSSVAVSGYGDSLAHNGMWKRQNADACCPLTRAPGGGNANLSRDSEVLFDSEFLQLAHDCFFPTSPKIQHAGDVPPPRLSSS